MVRVGSERLFSGIVVLLAVFAAGCMPSAAKVAADRAKSAEAVLTARAEARWAALIAADFVRAYAFETPVYREANTARMFMSRFGGAVGWTGARVMEVTPDASGEAASVRVMISYQAMDAVGGTIQGERPVDERWIRIGGEWWHTN